MPTAFLPDLAIHYRDDGPRDGPALVLLHPLGLDHAVWDALLPLLPAGLRVVRPDGRGHGGTGRPAGPWNMGALVRDAERLMDHLGLRDAVVMGCSMGGMVAQALAVKRLDLVRALVLANTAPRIGTQALWDDRIARVRAAGSVAVLAPAAAARWFARTAQDSEMSRHWQAHLAACDPEGWCLSAGAVAGADLYTPTAGLRLPVLCIAGPHDAATPPDMLRELADLIPGAEFQLIRGAGHLPMLDQPAALAAALTPFLHRIGHA